MSVAELLSRARALLAGGWHEPLSLDAQGAICGPDDEGVAHFCVADALAVAAAGDVAAHLRAEELLEQQAQLLPAGAGLSLNAWLAFRGRAQSEVVALFARAQARALAEESRR